MKKAILYVFFLDLSFIILLFVSGLLSGALSDIVYYLAFVLPFVIVLVWSRQERAPYKPPKVLIKPKNLALTIPLIFPTVVIILFFSWLSSLIFDGTASGISDNVAVAILTQALLTSILEEAFFRYLPLALLAPHSRKGAIILSAALFAVVHMNPHQLLYAFIAGIIFATVDLAFDSILPSIILHFSNNFLSVFRIFHGENKLFIMLFTSITVAASLLSLLFIYRRRKDYRRALCRIFRSKG